MSFKNRTTKEGSPFSSQFITYGVKLLKIVDIEVKAAKEGNRVQHIFHVETPAIGKNFSGFEREDGTKAEGLIGKVKLSIYFDPIATEGGDYDRREQFLDDITLIAEKAEVREALDEIDENLGWEETLTEYVKIIKDKFMWFLITAEEYDKGKFVLSFGTAPSSKNESGGYNYTVIVKNANFHIEGTLIRDEKSNLVEVRGTNVVGENKGKKASIKFDSQYHLKAYEPADVENNLGLDMADVGDDDLPF